MYCSIHLMNLDRDLLRHLPVVLAVAQRQGFAAAARELGMTPSAVSHAVRTVETALGETLFARTTRSVHTTEAGRTFLDVVDGALGRIAAGVEDVKNRGEARGVLRLNVPRVALSWVVTPLIARIHCDHPLLQIEATSDDALSDIVEGGFDAGIRLGQMVHADMLAIRLTSPIDVGVVAAPGYLERAGVPEDLADLAHHACITYRLQSGGLYRWELQEDGEDRVVDSPGPFIVNDYRHALDVVRAGLGLAYVFEPVVRKELAEGSLVPVLRSHWIEEPGLFLYHPLQSRGSAKIRALVSAAIAVRQELKRVASASG